MKFIIYLPALEPLYQPMTEIKIMITVIFKASN